MELLYIQMYVMDMYMKIKFMLLNGELLLALEQVASVAVSATTQRCARDSIRLFEINF